MVGADQRWAAAMTSLTSALERRGIELVPCAFPTYAALYEAMDLGACEAAWAPPLVALDLLRCAAALPVARPLREGQHVYYSILVTRGNEVTSLDELRGGRVAWVAPESAAGYVVPRLGLRSLGVDIDRHFGAQTFLGSHAAALDAVRAGAADLSATYATLDRSRRMLLPPPGAEGVRIVAAYGPIPSDVVVVSPAVPPAWQRALSFALGMIEPTEVRPLVDAMRFERFEPTSAIHLRPLEALDQRSDERALRPLAPFGVWAPGLRGAARSPEEHGEGPAMAPVG